MLEIINREQIIPICEKLQLPIWWVESVIVEYFPCRRFGEDGELWTFDFTNINDYIAQIPEKKVIIPNYRLVQNVRPNDLAQRGLITMIGLPVTFLDEADLIPEGLANYTCFPYPMRNDISVWDPKLEFQTTSVILDDGVFYQWTIGKSYEISEEHRLWFTSNLFDLTELDKINRNLQKFKNSDEIKNPNHVFIKKINDEYDNLETEREKIRKKIFEFHEKNKSKFNPKDAIVPKPPMLSYFETVKLTENGYQVKTHMEPIFLRSAIRNLHRAEDARSKRDSNPQDYDSLLDEIEYSAMCIINSTNCLETYINFIIRKYLPEESKIFDDTSSHRQKWIWVPTALCLSQKFNPSEPPFSNFSNLVKWRNNAIHHVPEYQKARGNISHTFNQFNLENAELAVKTVKDMIISLSMDSKIPLPRWMKTDMGSAEYWDEVRNYLQKLDEEQH